MLAVKHFQNEVPLQPVLRSLGKEGSRCLKDVMVASFPGSGVDQVHGATGGYY
jgi:hypothetical protein